MNLKNLKERKIGKEFEGENFKFDVASTERISTKSEKLWSYKNKEGKTGFVNIVKTKEGFVIDAIQEFEDKEFSQKLDSLIEKIENKIKEENEQAEIHNLFVPQEKPNGKEIENYLETLKIVNIYEKYIVKGVDNINLLLELKEKGYIKKLYSSNKNEVVVEFQKAETISQNFINKFKEYSMTLKEYEKPKLNLDMKEFLKLAQVEETKK